jgi:hypothetical protein
MKKILSILITLFALNISAQQYYRNTALDTMPVSINKGFTLVQSFNIVSSGTGNVFVKFYNQTTRVVKATDKPVLTIQIINTASVKPILYFTPPKFIFTKGLYVTCTNGIQDTSTIQPTIKPIIEIQY